jgi:glycosyltransferase EpsH
VEDYLARCLDSLVAQTLEEIEIIAVNDGSTDKSPEILHQYANKDHRIVVINKPNGGVSSARNEGIRRAKGEYIGFVDADDWVDKEMYKTMYESAIHEQADTVMCAYIREFGTHSKEKGFNLPEKVCFRNEEVQSRIMRRMVGPLNEEVANPEYLDAWGTVWSKLYRTEMIKRNQLQFIDLNVVGTNEDSLFNIHALYYTQSFLFLNYPFYHYRRNHNASLTSRYKPHLIDQWFKLYHHIESFLVEKGMQHDFHRALGNRVCLNLLGLGLNTISTDNKAPIKMKLRKLHAILNDDRIKRYFRQFEIRQFPVVWRAFYFCAKIRFSVGLYFMLIAINWLRRSIR